MEWTGFLALVLLLCYAGYPNKVKRLESKVKKLEHTQRGVNSMSKIISELVGQRCKIATDEALAFAGSNELECTVLDADDEWVKLSYTDKKGAAKTKLLRIDAIDSVELPEK